MKNGEAYITAKERTEAFCRDHAITKAGKVLSVRQVFNWLNLKVSENPLPCPFCGKDVHPYKAEIGYCVNCDHCGYVAGQCGLTVESAITEHNRVARAVAQQNFVDDQNS